MPSAATTAKAALCLHTLKRFVPAIRTFLQTVVAVMLMATLALPLLDKVTSMRAGPTRVMVFHHEYLAFGYRYWPEGVMKAAPTRKASSPSAPPSSP